VIELRQQSVLNFTAHGQKQFDRFLNLSTKLYSWLLQPISDMMADKRLIIVPDAVLGYLPFELLVNPSKLPNDQNDMRFYQDLPYIFYNHPISYAFSSTLKFASTSRKAHPSAGLWAYVPDYTLGVVSEEDSLASLRMQALPYAREEAESILKVWKNGKLMLSTDASKSNFLAFAPQAHILHLAMHAIIDDDNPLYSRLVFQQDSANPNSFELNTYELYSLRLNASLAVLSACNTGSGILRYGEGVISLTRGFIYAGVPSIVMSSWEVNDKAGAVLMEYFYQYLHEGYPKDVALQKARIDYLEHVNMLKGHPFFWGAYMLIGDNQPIETTHNHQFLLYLALPVFLLGLFIFLKMLKKQ
jgi:CHAT domain-containing protein